MGFFIAQLQSGDGLTSDGFGTCPGFAVVGTPAGTNKPARILFHMSLGAEDKFRDFLDAIRTSGMTVTKGIMYTVDTRASNPENNDPDMAGEVAGSEASFAYLVSSIFLVPLPKLQIIGARSVFKLYTRLLL
jgi:hypothetical protein